jgi:uncharacterized membrane protein YphA (DoxX/SURF4 family)
MSTFLRIVVGIIVFPYGMQKVFGWFSAPGFGAAGIRRSLGLLTARNISKFIAWLIITGQSFASIALMSGLLGRIAAGPFIIFTVPDMMTCLRASHQNPQPLYLDSDQPRIPGGDACLEPFRVLREAVRIVLC